MEEFIDSFINEAQELITQLEKDLLNLEKNPHDKEIINSVFRTMHTLKGSSGMLGFVEVQNFAHEFENIFDQVRKEKLEVTSDLIDITSKGIDVFLKLLKREDAKDDVNQVITLLKNGFTVSDHSDNIEKTEAQKNKPSADVNENCFCIYFFPDKGIFERGIDPLSTITELNEFGNTKVFLHENGLSWDEQKSKKVCQASWEIYLKSKSPLITIENVFIFFDADEYIIEPYISNALQKGSKFTKATHKFYANNKEFNNLIAQYFNELVLGDVEEKNEIKKETKAQQTKEVKEEQVEDKKPKFDSDTTINVASFKIDELLNLVSELVTSTASLESHAERLGDVNLKDSVENIEKLTKLFRNNALELRLIPLGTLFNRFKRQIRDLSRDLNKEINLIIEGQDTEIDKTILKALESPILHIIRNSIDHGIEPAEERIALGKSREGLLKMIAFYSGANVIIQIHDDGRGIDLEKVKKCAIEKGYIQPDQVVTDQELLAIIMEPGFTTSKNVSLVSGRGVGMDVVRKELNEVSGSIEIDTEKGLGTFMTLKLPTTLSIIDTLMIEVENANYLLPLLEVEYCYQEKRSVIFGNNNRYLRYKEEMVPFISLREKFNHNSGQNEEEMVVIIKKFHQRYALIVDKVIGEQQTVIKSLGELFIKQPYFSGGNIMVDGKLALILDTNYLFNRSILN